MNIKTSLIAISLFLTPAVMSAQTDDEITVDDNGHQENIEVPEAMVDDLDSLLQLYNAKMYLRPDTNCNMPDINPVYDDSVYKERLYRLPTIINMPYNPIVQKFIDRYTGELRRKVAYMLGAQNFFMPVFEEALETYDLPLELKYLPVIESGLNPTARSRAGAVGLWQFMLRTAKRYHLKVNSLVDERRDLVKASYTAAHYLSDLYKIYGDWYLVLAAYNAGPDKVNKAIRRSHGERDYWKIYKRLPKETRGYVPAFIAANYVMNYYCEHNICPVITNLPTKTDTVMVAEKVSFQQIAKNLDISIDQLRDLNPQYRRDIINGNTAPASLRLPAELISQFIEKEDSIYATSQAVQQSINSTAEDIDESDAETVSTPKKTYKRSTKKSTARKARKSRSRKSRSRKSRRQQTKSVTIKRGDTLSEIAERHHTTVKKLKKLNGISGSGIRAGKKIRVK